MSTDSSEQSALVPCDRQKGGKLAYFWTTCVAKPSHILAKRSVFLGSQIGNFIAQHARILPKLPEIRFNCDIKANFSINSRSHEEEEEKQERRRKIAQLEKEVYLLRSKFGLHDFDEPKSGR